MRYDAGEVITANLIMKKWKHLHISLSTPAQTQF